MKPHSTYHGCPNWTTAGCACPDLPAPAAPSELWIQYSHLAEGGFGRVMWESHFQEFCQTYLRSNTNQADEIARLRAEIERLCKAPEDTLSDYPGCVYCMEAGTPVKDGEVCPKCGDRLPTRTERRLQAELDAAREQRTNKE